MAKAVALPNPGADHVALEGASTSFRFRSARVPAGRLHSEAAFRFTFEGAEFGPMPVLDLSSTGLGLRAASVFMPPGAILENATLTYHGAEVWSGTAAVVYQVEGTSPRLGVRFVSGTLDMDRIYVRDSIVDGGLATSLEQLARERAELSADYRAAVADCAALLMRVQDLLSDFERTSERDDLGDAPNERAMLAAVHETWAPHYYGQIRELYALSHSFTREQRELSRQYASQMLLPLLRACPMHRRARDKPFGYAGDYALMRMFFMEHSPADTLYGRFLHYTFQRYALARAVVARERCLRASVHEALARATDTVRIVSLGCGPVIELARLIDEVTSFDVPVEFILVDQDDAALAYCHRELSARLSQHPAGRQVELHCLHFSVRQLLKPRNQAEQRVVDHVLVDVDLIYSAGLFDYLPKLVARHLVQTLYGLVRPGGRLFIGNLRASEDSTWVMENLLSWHLEYRERQDMLELVGGAQAEVHVLEDATGHCLFLQLDKP